MLGSHVQTGTRLAILADGGALHDLNSSLRVDRVKVDFNQIPALVATEAAAVFKSGSLAPDPTTQVLFNLGSSGSEAFLRSIGETWVVREVARGMCEYERPMSDSGTQRAPLIRFEALISYYLGLIVSSRPDGSQLPVVAVVSDDPHLVPVLADAVARGLKACICWFAPLPGDLVYYAKRNGVPVVELSTGASAASARDKEEPVNKLLARLFS